MTSDANIDAATALLLVDIQNDYFPGGAMELRGTEEAADRAAIVLARFRDKGAPVIHVRHEAARPGATFFLPGSWGAAIHATVAPAPGEPVVTKAFPNSFRETELAARLDAAGAKRLVVCGMMTHMCVDATVRAAFDLGYPVTVVADACATRGLSFGGRNVAAPDVQAAFLAALGAVYATVVAAADLV
ncbi:isochorismatase hydrolase [Solidesulfovibrio fructosivorans JJ]]|uniref:Isochorismatase hydrolase n=1 Tax=Solidesulfovibrio fructosivorans JJ] TaxID=596151 RepID=E1K2L4_SOLFR|nr:cysteine hydrolase family protein [Solidesulfovibrio fructosivorans]EFL49146.1 isochorismatase hydrolase [Solidesulfovibrio fructosivorans JJ]]